MIKIEINQVKNLIEMKGSILDIMAELALCASSLIDTREKIEDKDNFAYSIMLGIISSVGIKKLEDMIKTFKEIDKNQNLFKEAEKWQN